MTDTTLPLADEQREALAGVWNVLCVLIADHPMWIGDDGEPLDYLPEREVRVSDFIGEATDALSPLIARMVADAERRALREAVDALKAAREDRWAAYLNSVGNATKEALRQGKFEGLDQAVTLLCRRIGGDA